MSDKPKSSFARRIRAAKPRARKYKIRDDMVTGLGLAVQSTGVTVPEASAEAHKLIAAFLDTAKNDNGPRMPGHPMDAFTAEFLERQVRHWKPRTWKSNAYMVGKYILPGFGHMTVDAIAVEHVKDWSASMADQPGAANRVTAGYAHLADAHLVEAPEKVGAAIAVAMATTV